MKNGIDVSWAQGKLDWSKIKTDFAIIKCNTGVNCPDEQLQNNAAGCHEHCIPFGFYHWATLNKTDVVPDAISEAKDFIKALKELPTYSIMPALDIEEDNKLKLPPHAIELWIKTFADEMIKAGHGLIIYSYKPWLDANLPRDHKLGYLPLWLAAYPWDKPAAKESPVFPAEVGVPRHLPNGWNDYFMWQYTGQGSNQGIKGFVDLNKMK